MSRKKREHRTPIFLGKSHPVQDKISHKMKRRVGAYRNEEHQSVLVSLIREMEKGDVYGGRLVPVSKRRVRSGGRVETLFLLSYESARMLAHVILEVLPKKTLEEKLLSSILESPFGNSLMKNLEAFVPSERTFSNQTKLRKRSKPKVLPLP